MKTSSKVYFILGALTTIGTIVLITCVIQNSDKSPEKLLKDSKKFIKKSGKRAERLLGETSSSFKKEANKIMKDASKIY